MSTLGFVLLAFQIQSSGSVDRETLLVIFVGIIAFFFLALIAGLLGAVIYALKLKRDVLKSIDSLKATVQAKAYPVVASTNEFIREMTPKIKSITEDAVGISHTIRAQVTDLDSTLTDVTAKARAQADRVNGMVNSTLEKTTTVANAVEKNVKLPFREVAGIVAGVKAGWNVLLRPNAPSAKSEVKRAARHVESWEEEIAADATRAAAVNRETSAGATYRGSDSAAPTVGTSAPHAVGEARRSLVEAGEEMGGPAKVVTERTPETTPATLEDLQERRSL